MLAEPDLQRGTTRSDVPGLRRRHWAAHGPSSVRCHDRRCLVARRRPRHARSAPAWRAAEYRRAHSATRSWTRADSRSWCCQGRLRAARWSPGPIRTSQPPTDWLPCTRRSASRAAQQPAWRTSKPSRWSETAHATSGREIPGVETPGPVGCSDRQRRDHRAGADANVVTIVAIDHRDDIYRPQWARQKRARYQAGQPQATFPISPPEGSTAACRNVPAGTRR